MMRLTDIVSEEHAAIAAAYIGGLPFNGVWDVRDPDVTIAPNGEAYIYRWHLIKRNALSNLYFHIQVQDDPERPLHDHPWDNTSMILAGGYHEIVWEHPPAGTHEILTRRPGDLVHRRAEAAHRLVLLREPTQSKKRVGYAPYSMSLFMTGPHRRTWGFWSVKDPLNPQWISQTKCIKLHPDGRSTFEGPRE